jgi:hypothetical protein
MEAAARGGGDVGAAQQAYLEAGLAVHAHPLWEEARNGKCHHQTAQALTDTVRD